MRYLTNFPSTLYLIFTVLLFFTNVSFAKSSCNSLEVTKKEQVLALIKEIRKDPLANKNLINEGRIEKYVKAMDEKWIGNLQFIHSVLCTSRKIYQNEEYYVGYFMRLLHPGKIINYTHEFELKEDKRVPFMLELLEQQSDEILAEKNYFKSHYFTAKELLRCLSLYPGDMDDALAKKLKSILNSDMPAEEQKSKVAKALGFNKFSSCSYTPYTILENKIFSGKPIADLLKGAKNKALDTEKLHSILFSNSNKKILPDMKKILFTELNPNMRGLNAALGPNGTTYKQDICDEVSDKYHDLANVKNIIEKLNCPVTQTHTAIGEERSPKDIINAFDIYTDNCKKSSKKSGSKFSKNLLSNINRAIRTCSSFSLIESQLIFYAKCSHTLAPNTIAKSIKKLREGCSKDRKDVLSYCQTELYAWALESLNKP